MSYPRSGNTWFRYCVEQLTGLPTSGYEGKDMYHGDPKVRPIAIKTHILNNESLPKSISGAVLLIRNPFYVIPRHRKDTGLVEFEKGLHHYITIIDKFEEVDNSKTKLYLKYEHIMREPEEFLIELAKLLSLPTEKATEFHDNIDFHKEESLKFYNRSYGKSQTNGVIESQQINRDYLDEKVKLLLDKYPRYCHKYLMEYIDELK